MTLVELLHGFTVEIKTSSPYTAEMLHTSTSHQISLTYALKPVKISIADISPPMVLEPRLRLLDTLKLYPALHCR